MKKNVFYAVAFLFLLSTASIAETNKGSETITLPGEKKEAVTLSHWKHQENLKDCQACHKLFSMEPGAIKKQVNAKKLKSKQVMNRTCIKCHRSLKKAGEAAGPTKCTGCHVK